ncbi:MAG TPA: glycosyltransferase [Tabrizicola sp.]|nr:glycosyltransferase [Tabrizicola sp.]
MIERKLFRRPAPGSPLVIAVFSYRYEAHLVPDFIANIRPAVHGYVAWDDRASTTSLSSEPERRNRLLAEARAMGARWILAVDPDERVEDRLAERLPELVSQGEGNLWMFQKHEMFTPDSYRVEGIWGEKHHLVLFPMAAVRRDLEKALHGAWVARTGFVVRHAQVNIYHFRMATPERRRLRRELYAAADPKRHLQRVGYDYLDDERGMILEQIPKGREFSPPFHEDHGLWSPDPGELGEVLPDPIEARLALIRKSVASRGHLPASHVVQDLAHDHPNDTALLPMAAMLALTAGDLPRTRALASAALAQTPDSALAVYLRGCAALGLGDQAGYLADLARLQALVGPGQLSRELQSLMSRATEDFTRPEAQWRRWVPGDAICREGSRISAGQMAVVVIGYRSPPDLASAVASLRAQDPACEIVVVNSGGGPVERILAQHLDAIRLITTEHRLYAGAARNIGIDASRAGIVGFLASDCQAMPGWVAGRLRAHALGARSVSNPVVPEPGASPVSVAGLKLRYSVRSPDTPLSNVSHFGRSYTREARALAGCFPSGLRGSEDQALNARIDRIARCVWAPDVLTTHKEPSSLWRMMAENLGRGIRMASHPPFRNHRGSFQILNVTLRVISRRFARNRKLLSSDDSLNAPQKKRLLRFQRQIALAQFLGVSHGLRNRARASRAEDRARQAAAKAGPAGTSRLALRLARRAVALDPQDWRKQMLLGDLLEAHGEEGTKAFRTAVSLAPAEPDPVARLLAPILKRGAVAEALHLAETAAQDAPQVAEHWLKAAEIAASARQGALATAYAQRALSLSPDQPSAHARTAALFKALGQPVAAALRQDMADRLRAFLNHTESK